MEPDLASQPEAPASAGPGLPWKPVAAIIFVGVVIYANSFSGVFVFDDMKLGEDPAIRSLWPPWLALSSISNAGRPVVVWTLAANYAMTGFDTWSYHLFNLIVHLLASLALFGVLRRTLRSKRLVERFGPSADLLSLAITLVWMAHPLNTESVTYIVQRAESLMGLLYLAALYCSIRGAEDQAHRWRWYGVAIFLSAIGMATKPVMVTAPVVILAYHAIFSTGSVSKELRERAWFYAGLAATWLILIVCLKTAKPELESAGFSVHNLTPWSYFRSQFGAITLYLRLSIWPSPLCLDYVWPVAGSAREIIPYAVVIGLLGVATLFALYRRPELGFLGLWFFVILAPTSSFVPIFDVAVEHRMYLSLAAVVALVVLAVYGLADRVLMPAAGSQLRSRGSGQVIGLALLGAAVLLLGVLTIQRNRDYHDRVIMWQDVVAQRPENPRAHNNLGLYLSHQGNLERATAHFAEALRLNPLFAEAHNNMGMALANSGRPQEAGPHFLEAIAIRPTFKTAHFNLGQVFSALGKSDQAIIQYEEELKINPAYPDAHLFLGMALERENRFAESIDHYRAALSLRPQWPQVMCNLALTLIKAPGSGPAEAGEAIMIARQAVQLTGGRHPVPVDILARAYAAGGRFEDAVAAGEEAITLASPIGDADLSAALAKRLQDYKARKTER